ncbi:MAG: hypothetical protein J0G30_12205 [Actinomycetales bacterium]|nr:hypothetical protein [Actinomycetales bacterium]
MSEHEGAQPSVSEHGGAQQSVSEPVRPAVLGADGRPIEGSRPKRPRRAWDIGLSILLLLLAAATALLGFILAVFNLAFVVDCSSALCSPGRVVGSQYGSGVAVAVILVSGTIFTMFSIVRWRRGWWAALLTFLLVLAAWIVGWVLLNAAAGG